VEIFVINIKKRFIVAVFVLAGVCKTSFGMRMPNFLLNYCERGDMDSVKRLLESYGQENVNSTDKLCRTPLYWACYNNNLRMAKLLLGNGAGASINMTSSNKTPLYWAYKNGNRKMVELLLQYGARERACLSAHYSEAKFHGALRNKAIKSDLEAWIKNCIIGTSEAEVLRLACEKKNAKMVATLLKSGSVASVNMADEKGRTPLHLACQNSNLKMVRLLLDHGAGDSVNMEDEKGKTPLHYACACNNVNMIELLWENGAKASVNISDKSGKTPFGLACYRDNLEIVRLFLKDCPRENVVALINGHNGESPLAYACRANSLDMVCLLLDYGVGANVNVATKDGMTPLSWACFNDNATMLALLWRRGAAASVNMSDESGQTPLYFVCKNGNLEKADFLLNNGAGASINKANAMRENPLYWGCYNDDIEMVQLLLEYDATISDEIIKKTNHPEIKGCLEFVAKYDRSEDKCGIIEEQKARGDFSKAKLLAKRMFLHSMEQVMNQGRHIESTTFANMYAHYDGVFLKDIFGVGVLQASVCNDGSQSDDAMQKVESTTGKKRKRKERLGDNKRRKTE